MNEKKFDVINNPAKLLEDSGLLVEINRLILHPKGLHLSVSDSSVNGDMGNFSMFESDSNLKYTTKELFDNDRKLKEFSKVKGEVVLDRIDKLGFLIQK